ncbi:hypothetical protein BGW80DRAFT_303011 [Lactifluus volemus]|nr:hypothetical protein BGW80DRAFT_303011 [Lactifluus volemus]
MTSQVLPLSSFPSHNGLPTPRIQPLYSDISRQKHSNPTTYSSNVAWWHSTLESITSRGWLPSTPDRLILHADQSLLETLRYEGAAIFKCFPLNIRTQVATYRIAAFVGHSGGRFTRTSSVRSQSVVILSHCVNSRGRWKSSASSFGDDLRSVLR